MVNNTEPKDAKVSIALMEKGSYIVRGNVKLMDTEAKELGVPKDVNALCYCGDSSNKPFCDGTHSTRDG
jgi:CDGSH-type Zn-finger protein